MQTFIVKLGCLFLFGFIFYAAYQTNTETNTLSDVEAAQQSTTILISNGTNATEVEFTEQTVTNSLKFN